MPQSAATKSKSPLRHAQDQSDKERDDSVSTSTSLPAQSVLISCTLGITRTARFCSLASKSQRAKVPFINMPPFEHKRISSGIAGHIPHNTYRYLLHSKFRSNNYEVHRQATHDIHTQMGKWLQKQNLDQSITGTCRVNIRDLHGLAIADVGWPVDEGAPCPRTLDDSGRPLQLVVDGRQARFVGVGPRGEVHEITISVRLDPDCRIAEFTDVFDTLLGKAGRVVDVWRAEESKEEEDAKWTGELQVLVSLFDPVKWMKSAEDVKISAAALPGFINYNQSSYRLQYLHRREWCFHCKASTTEFHCSSLCRRNIFRGGAQRNST